MSKVAFALEFLGIGVVIGILCEHFWWDMKRRKSEFCPCDTCTTAEDCNTACEEYYCYIAERKEK